MKYLVNPTLPLEGDQHQVVQSMQYSINPTLPLENDVSTSNVFFTTSLEPSGQGGTHFTLNEPQPSHQINPFDWNSLAASHLPSIAPFQMKVQVKHYTVARYIVDEGSYVSILSMYSSRGMGYPNLMSTVNQSLAFDRRPSKIWEFLFKHLSFWVGSLF